MYAYIMSSQTIQCKDCQQNFEFTEKEQKFYQKKGFVTPKRCKACRKIKKAREVQGGIIGLLAQHPERISREVRDELEKYEDGTYMDFELAHTLYDDLPDGAYFAAMEEATGYDPSALVGYFEDVYREPKPRHNRKQSKGK